MGEPNWYKISGSPTNLRAARGHHRCATLGPFHFERTPGPARFECTRLPGPIRIARRVRIAPRLSLQFSNECAKLPHVPFALLLSSAFLRSSETKGIAQTEGIRRRTARWGFGSTGTLARAVLHAALNGAPRNGAERDTRTVAGYAWAGGKQLPQNEHLRKANH